ncbi:MAG: hypothetical protein JWP31_1813 [Aeromicrobium sp.]|nr:hypothetical protein [Aeromicrobium sp.]
MTAPVKRGAFRRSCRTCGWDGTYDSAARGDYAKKRHSCAKRLADAERTKRHSERLAAIDRTPKPCTHKEADHQHGTYACYILDKCRCTACCDAQYAWYDQNNREKAYGRWDNLIPATHARAHVLHLMDQGMGIKRISKVSGVSQGVMWKLLYGKPRPDGTRTPSKRIRKDTAERLLRTQLNLADGAVIDSTEVTRRLQALVAIGWSMSKLAERLDVSASNFTDTMHGRRRVTVATARAVDALYDELSMTLPPEGGHRDRIAATRARNYAAQAGWLPPLDLEVAGIEPDDDANDIAHDDAAVWRSTNGDRSVELTPADRHEVIRVLHRRGLTDLQMAELTGFDRNTVITTRNRLGLPVNSARIDWSEYGERRTSTPQQERTPA